jgi:mono/diheme cytochrome c family protein
MRPLACFLALCLAIFVAADEKSPPVPAKPQAADSFVLQVKPLIQKYCIDCHNDKKASGELNLTAFKDTASAMKQFATWETIKKRLELKEMPPKNKPAPSDDERKRLVFWIGAELAKANTALASPGRVTLRRLNRVEYNLTIQDLTGVSFRPADDFPADDVGNGFDNIGDVLSLPPLLMEKYLSAAEQIVERVFAGDPIKPDIRRYALKDLQASDKAETKTRDNVTARMLDAAGTLYVTHDVPRDGELIVRPVLFARPAGREAKNGFVRAGLQLDDKEFHTQRVTFGSPGEIEGRVKVTAGTHRIAVALLNASDETVKENRKTLGIIAIQIENPPEKIDKPQSYKRVLIGDAKDESRGRAERILTRFALRAYRRPAKPEEISRLMKLFDMARKDDSFDKSVGLALQATLVSPHFLFRVEPDRKPDRPDGSYPLNDYEIASRLSYFLWSTMPDDELFRLGEQGKLHEPAMLEAQVARMLKDPKISALVENFGMQWLNLRNLQTVQPSRRDFYAWDESLRTAMRLETEMFIAAIVAEDRSILDFLDADFTFLNGKLARFYDIPGISGEKFQRVKLTDRNRGGVLTQASVLTVTSNPTRTSPVKRGKWILENILGTPPPPPPPDVPELKEGKDALTGTLRERMKQHRVNPNCATCHERMDTIGFGFENFDAIGGWRTTDGKFKIDASGTLPDGKSFQTPAELKHLLLKSQEPEFRRCLTEKLLTYALGRGLERSDRPEVERIATAVANDRNRFNRMVLEIVKGDAFQRRTVKR